jgi:hypothetical protein
MTGPDANLTKKITDLAILATIGDVENKQDIHCIMNTVSYNFKMATPNTKKK